MALSAAERAAFEALANRAAERDAGSVRAALLDFAGDLAAAEPLLAAEGLTGARAAQAREIDRARAAFLLARVLGHDQAYDSGALPPGEAEALAAGFLALFGPEAAFFTNGRHDEKGRLSGWTPFTTATFDTGVIALGRDRLGLLWCEDED